LPAYLPQPLGAKQLRPLQPLASRRHGASEELLGVSHGFSRRLLAGLVRAGIATVRRRVIMAGDTPVEVGKVIITDAGPRRILCSSLFKRPLTLIA
jgi:hypothetical protein